MPPMTTDERRAVIRDAIEEALNAKDAEPGVTRIALALIEEFFELNDNLRLIASGVDVEAEQLQNIARSVDFAAGALSRKG